MPRRAFALAHVAVIHRLGGAGTRRSRGGGAKRHQGREQAEPIQGAKRLGRRGISKVGTCIRCGGCWGCKAGQGKLFGPPAREGLRANGRTCHELTSASPHPTPDADEESTYHL